MSEVFFSCKRMTGIEPASKAWEALILPMNYIRICYIFAKQTTEKPKALRLSSTTLSPFGANTRAMLARS